MTQAWPLLLLFSICLSASLTHRLPLRLSLSMRKIFSWSRKTNKKTWGGGRRGTQSQCGGAKATRRPVTAFRSQREGNSDKRRFQTPCQGRNSLLILSICKQDFLGLGHFLLLFKFLVRHLLSLLTVPLVMEEDNLPARGREKGRERQRKRER